MNLIDSSRDKIHNYASFCMQKCVRISYKQLAIIILAAIDCGLEGWLGSLRRGKNQH